LTSSEVPLIDKGDDGAATIVRAMTAFPIRIVSAVNGLGASLASLSDPVVMDERTYLADPHIALGLVASDGGAITWPLDMGLQRVKEWLLLGARIDAERLSCSVSRIASSQPGRRSSKHGLWWAVWPTYRPRPFARRVAS
jgi:Enoyl-CoA hydratase/isomerase